MGDSVHFVKFILLDDNCFISNTVKCLDKILCLLIQAKHNESDREHNAAAREGGSEGVPGKEGDPSTDGGQSKCN